MEATMKNELVTPEMEYVTRDLNIFLMADESWSLKGLRMAALNQALREAFGTLKPISQQHPEVKIKVRCIAFSDFARWHIGPDAVAPEDLEWQDLSARRSTRTGAAIKMLTESITMDMMPSKGYPPVMVLVSDGDNTDGKAYDTAIEQLKQEPWGAKAIRLAIGIGNDYKREQLEKFINRPDIGVLEARNTVDLVNYIEFAIVTAALSSLSSMSNPTGNATTPTNIAVSTPPASVAPQAAENNIQLEVI